MKRKHLLFSGVFIALFSAFCLALLVVLGFLILMGANYFCELKEQRETAASLHAPTEEIAVPGQTTEFTDVSEALQDVMAMWKADALVKAVKGSSLYTINAQNDALVNVYAVSGRGEAKVYVKHPELIPETLNAQFVSAVSLAESESELQYGLALSEAQIQYLFQAFLDQVGHENRVGFTSMAAETFSEGSLEFHFYLKGIDGLYFYLPLYCRYAPETNQYYLQCWQASKYLLLPKDMQSAIQNACS